MSSDDDSDTIFKALADRKRRAILDALKDEPKTTGQLVALFPQIDRCTVMQHMKVLETAGLIVARKEGRERWNHLNALPIKSIHDRWIGDYARNAVGLMSRLETELKA
ncbi:helix-turn-helix domain-containing protein [Pelagibacterium flavum]|uniref:Helix-turn-helix domain-containing protein n=1 Tax=Pelagibacterium flavum TaxID=2984530 RepID=A0ABY6IVD5_9HYPH|nr:metalloregulator ArsR/SmtB family transcription factor [Pelagibacterium sp. YIM 151497]UYQ73252.1 helix-turn-helix domain-containing protein [Pelagibacterium sp. YIM 151497]|tara:strand:- start:6 stop:329 length:324 start_codon:yes stop_codon:yes gene_type:complete